jgi:hypothetical protein
MTRSSLLAIALSLLSGTSPAAQACQPCPIPKQPVVSGDAAITLAKRVVPAYKLTSIPVQCLDFRLDSKHAGSGYEIDVHEVHSKECGGDEMFSPRVMSIHIQDGGTVTTDAYSLGTDASYRPVVCKKTRQRIKR